MLNWFGPTLMVTCSPTRLTVQRRTRFGHDCDAPVIYDLASSRALQDAPRGRPTQGLTGLFDQFSSALTKLELNGATIDIVLDDAWCRLFMTTPPSNPATLADLTAAVALRFQILYGDSASDWVLQNDQQATMPFVCAAMPQAMHRGFIDIAKTSGSRITRLVPAYVDGWRRVRRLVGPGNWFAQIGDAQLTLAVFDKTHIRHLVQMPLDPLVRIALQPAWLIQLAQREALRLNLPPPERIVCAGSVSAAWTTADFAGQPCQVVTEQKRISRGPKRGTAATASTEPIVSVGPSR